MDGRSFVKQPTDSSGMLLARPIFSCPLLLYIPISTLKTWLRSEVSTFVSNTMELM